MKKIIAIMMVILGALVALVLIAPSSAENVKNLPDSAEYVMFRSDLWKAPIDAENCGEVTVSRKEDMVYTDFYFISPLEDQEYIIYLVMPMAGGGVQNIEIGEVTTDGNGVGDIVITLDPYEIMTEIYDAIVAIYPPSPPAPPLPPIEMFFAGTQYLPQPSFLLDANLPPSFCGVDCDCPGDPPPTQPCSPPDGAKIVNAFKLTNDGSIFFTPVP